MDHNTRTTTWERPQPLPPGYCRSPALLRLCFIMHVLFRVYPGQQNALSFCFLFPCMCFCDSRTFSKWDFLARSSDTGVSYGE